MTPDDLRSPGRRGPLAAAAAVAVLVAGACDAGPGADRAPGCPYPADGPHPVHREADPGRWLSDVPVRHVEPRAVLGASGEDAGSGPVLENVVDVVRTPSGPIAVADAEARRVRVLDSSGEELLSTGREGRGPEPFFGLAAVGVSPGDSLRAFDAGAWREAVFDASGDLLATSSPPARERTRGGVDLAYDPEGTLYHLSYRHFVASFRPAVDEREQTVARGDVVLERWSRGGDAWRTLDTVPGVRVFSDRGELRDAPFAPRPLWSPAAGGGVWYADSGEYLLTRLSASGDTLCRVRVDVEPPSVSEKDRRAYLEADDVNPYSVIFRRRIQKARREMPIPDRRPALRALVADGDGGVWVRPSPERWNARADTVTWHAFSRAGRLVGRVRLPGDLRIERVSGDTVLGVRSAEDGVDQVVVLEVVEDG